MPETTKDKNEQSKNSVETECENNEKNEGAWSKDQREKGYYYDDDHGYEIYNPEEDDEEED